MIVELNVGLDRPGGPNEPFRRRLCAAALINLLEGYAPMNPADGAQVLGDVEGVDEPCVWAEIGVWSLQALERLCDEMCDMFAQDCIAVRYSDRRMGEGVLIGPKAAEWGEVNPENFRRPAGLEGV